MCFKAVRIGVKWLSIGSGRDLMTVCLKHHKSLDAHWKTKTCQSDAVLAAHSSVFTFCDSLVRKMETEVSGKGKAFLGSQRDHET